MDTLVEENLSALTQRVTQARLKLEQRRGFALALAERGVKLQDDIAELKSQVLVLEKASIILASISEQRQLGAQQQIEVLVTRGLQVVFGEHMSFHLVRSVKSKQPTVDFIVRTTYPDGTYLDTEVWGATGGGLAAVVGFVLRVVILLLTPGKEGVVLCMDEPFSGVSAGYAEKLMEFLKELVEKTPLQFVFVAHTHVDELAEIADKRYRVTQVQGDTKVKEF